MSTQPVSSPFKDVLLSRLPQQYVTPQGKQQFLDIAQRFDTLGRIDPQTQQVFVDEHQLRSLLETHLPPGVAASCLSALKAAPGSAFITPETQQNTSQLSWLQLSAEIRKSVKSPAIEDTQLGPSPTSEQIIQTLRQFAPNAPESLFEPKTFRDRLLSAAGATSISAENENIDGNIVSSIWNCLVSNLGFWVALAAVTIVIVVASAVGAALVASGGTLGVVFWEAFWSALAVAGPLGASFYVITVIVVCMGY